MRATKLPVRSHLHIHSSQRHWSRRWRWWRRAHPVITRCIFLGWGWPRKSNSGKSDETRFNHEKTSMTCTSPHLFLSSVSHVIAEHAASQVVSQALFKITLHLGAPICNKTKKHCSCFIETCDWQLPSMLSALLGRRSLYTSQIRLGFFLPAMLIDLSDWQSAYDRPGTTKVFMINTYEWMFHFVRPARKIDIFILKGFKTTWFWYSPWIIFL